MSEEKKKRGDAMPRVSGKQGHATTCKLPFDRGLVGSILAGITRKDIESKTMFTKLINEMIIKVKQNESISCVNFKKYNHTWVVLIPKEPFRELKASCLERDIDWQGFMRAELIMLAKDLYVEGHILVEPIIPETKPSSPKGK